VLSMKEIKSTTVLRHRDRVEVPHKVRGSLLDRRCPMKFSAFTPESRAAAPGASTPTSCCVIWDTPPSKLPNCTKKTVVGSTGSTPNPSPSPKSLCFCEVMTN